MQSALSSFSFERSLILVVEDDDSIRETFRLFLEAEGYAVTTACNGQEGLNSLTGLERPSLIILDLTMPIMDGWEFLRRIKADASNATIPVVIVSAIAGNQKVASASQVLPKPVDFVKLLDAVSRYCGPPKVLP